MRRTHYLVIILLLIAQTSFGQIYQNMAQPGYKFSRARFDSVLTIPTGLGNLKNITGGQDTGQIRFNVSDSSVYVWNGRAWIKPVGGTDTASLSNRINLKVNISDTAAMLSPYAKTAALAAKLNISDTATMLSAYARSAAVTSSLALKLNISDTATMLSNYAKTAAVNLKLNISDTATMLAPYTRVTVSSYGKNAGGDSTILLLSNGTRYAAKDSVSGGSGWSLTGNASAVTDFLGTTNNRTMRFRTNNAERMVIDSTGSVGIGTSTNAGFKLDVFGPVRLYPRGAINGGFEFTNADVYNIMHSNTYTYLSSNNAMYIGGVGITLIGTNKNESQSQLGLGYQSWQTNLMSGSAKFDIRSTTQGFLMPRMTTVQRDAIATPATGLQVYNTTTNAFNFYNGTAWGAIGGGSGWSLTGNASAVTDFLGTTNNRTMRFRTNNVERMVIDSIGTVTVTNDAVINSMTVGKGKGNYNGNTVLGFAALSSNTTSAANNNTAIGYEAMRFNTTGGQNSAFGQGALYINTTGIGNTAFGRAALYFNTTGNSNTAIGQGALYFGAENTIAIGSFSGYNTQQVDEDDNPINNTGASNGLYIGANIKTLNVSQTNEIIIGNDALGLGSNTTVIGNSSTTLTALSGNVTAGATIKTAGYTVATLPAGTIGMMAYVTDAVAPTYLGALTGGGAIKCPVFYNGTAWVSH